MAAHRRPRSLDEKGNLWITGRCKDMIIRGGENIAPVAVERALMTIPGVPEAAVFGVPHADLGEEVIAVVVAEGEVTAAQLQEQLRSKVASFAVPTRWRLQTDPLPTTRRARSTRVPSAQRSAASLLSSQRLTRHDHGYALLPVHLATAAALPWAG